MGAIGEKKRYEVFAQIESLLGEMHFFILYIATQM